MDVNIRFLAALSLILNIFFAVNFFGFLPGQTEPNQTYQVPEESEIIGSQGTQSDFKVDLSDSALLDYHSKLLIQGFTSDQTKPLVLSKLKRDYIDIIPRPNDEYWLFQPLVQINYMQSLAEGFNHIRQQLVSLYGPTITDELSVREIFYPLASQYPFLSSQEQIAVQSMQLKMQQHAMEAQSRGGKPGSMSAEQSPKYMLSRVLSEQALKEYQLRSSPLSNKIRQTGISFTEEKFRKSYDILAPLSSIQDVQEAFDARADIYKLLGDNDGLTLWAAIDPVYKSIKMVASKHQITEGQALSAYELILQAKQDLSTAANERTNDPQGSIYQVQAAIIELKNQLKDLVGESAANDLVNVLKGRRPAMASRPSNN